MKKNATEINELGEFGLIERITQGFEQHHSSTILGIGDDAAIIDHENDVMVVTTDMLIEGVHFDLSYTPLKHLGYKAVVVNLSDVYAMNAKATHITVSIGISSRFSVEDIEELYEGIKHACRIYRVDLVGGDTVASQSGLVLSITAIGHAAKEKISRRSGAQENDLICVTGDLGSAYLGLKLLMREKEVLATAPHLK
ncbi:MAG TPA: thiamine-phosphate kinase, partial [Salinivirgaceae bacterium]|nr:thiamine-phosphate kinase [Salinivirgaceae bacterium]